MEEIYSPVFTGLTLFYRDTSLAENLISLYRMGQILMERGFTDMSYKGGGIASNLRYLIASSHAKDVSAISPDTAVFGQVVLPFNSWFKVVDIYRLGDKTQIFLLEIPENAVELFANTNTDLEEDLVKKARSNFEANVNLPPVPELQFLDWKERTEFPIGMSNKGEFFHS